MQWFFRHFARLPLAWLHAFGIATGWLVYWSSPGYAARMRENIAHSGLCASPAACRQLLRQAIGEAGKSVLELPAIWLRPYEQVLQLVRRAEGLDKVKELAHEGHGILFLTPHLGCFEISSLFIANHMPITILYRPPKLRWTEPPMLAGRGRGQVSMAPTDLKGVKALLKALKHGQSAGILPDQVPGKGEGVWADFFGRPAYTMTLVQRLQHSTGAAIVLVFAERLPGGRGYDLWFEPLAEALPQDAAEAARAINAAVENLARRNPAQYLWSYNRYKAPKGSKEEAKKE
ncbi:MAG: lysophospholipid acyltransferase family protein [Sulfurimicrobium sp.]